MYGWTKKSERRLKGNFGGIKATLLCPDMESIPEKHNKWLFYWDGSETYTVVGTFGDELEIIVAEGTEQMAINLRAAAQALSLFGKDILPDSD